MSNSFTRIKELSPEQRDLLLRRLVHAKKQEGEPEKLTRFKHDGAAGAPLSFAQERQWFLDRLNPGDPAFNITGSLRLVGNLSLPALQKTFDAIVRRHDTLRANFSAPAGDPVQTIRPPAPVNMNVVDLSHLDAASREAETRRLYAEETARGFDLANDPLLRVRLLRLGDPEHFLIFAMHHIVSDGWSIGVLLEEMARLYTTFVEGKKADLPDLPVSYADFAAWQRRRLRDWALEHSLAFWRKQLEEPPLVLELRPDRLLHSSALSAERDLAGAISERLVGKKLKQDLEALCRREDCTMFVTLLTAFMVLLMRCSAREDILIGSPVSGRIRVETEGLVGLFLNTLALRAWLPAELSFREAIALVRKTVLDGLAHHEVPFERVVQETDPERSSASHPLFETFFNFTPSPPRVLELPGLRASFEAPVGMRSEFSLVLYVTEWEGTLELKALYQCARYSQLRMDCFMEQLESILHQVVSDSERRLGSLDLSTALSQRLLPDPAKPLDRPEQIPVTVSIAEWIARTPDKPAVVQGDAILTYAQLGGAMDALARRLRAAGLKPGDVVAVRGPRSPGFVACMAGALRAGGVLMNLSVDLPTRRQHQMMQQSGARFLFQVGPQRNEDDGPGEMPGLVIITVDALGGLNGGRAPANDSDVEGPSAAGHAPAYIFFTSGSTGTPKAVRGTHQGLAHFLAWQRQTFDVGPADRCAQLTGLSFDVVLRDVFLPLTSGAVLVLPPDGDSGGASMVRWLEQERITLLHTVPSVAETWLLDLKPGVPLSSLKHTFFAGEPLTAALVERWRQAFPEAGEIVNLYGPTETTLAKCFYRVPAQPRAGIQPIGRPLPQTQILVLTPQRTVCGIGEPGEIAVRTPFRSLGYLDAAEENARRFIANPFSGDADDRLYLTGDRGAYCADGMIEFLGRLDHQVKLHGVRIEPAEVAATLQSCPEVATCAVVAREDTPGAPVLVAYVVLRRGVSESTRRLREFLRQRLPAPMVPSRFVILDSLPLTPNQKLDRDRLPAPGGTRPNLESSYTAPRDVTELRLTQIWEDLLNVRPVGVTDNFFDLGGHSLLSLRLLVKIEQSLGTKLPLATLFESPTIEHLAAVTRRQNREQSQVVSLWSADHRLKLFLVHTGGGTVLNYVPLVRHLAPEVPVYGIQALGLDGEGEPQHDLVQMAADYVAKMRELQPEGPYLLAGHSLGGIIAFEMARQLDEAGAPVALLAMFDSILARGPEDDISGHDADARVLAEAATTIGRFVGKEVELSPDALRTLSTEARIDYVLDLLARRDALAFDGAAALVRNLLTVSRAHLVARRAYRPAVSPVPITLFRARDARPSDHAAADADVAIRQSLGWSAVSTHPVGVRWVAGDHVTMMNEPHAGGLAQNFGISLSEALRS
jgi:amino acid adenylation domain-containing protein